VVLSSSTGKFLPFLSSRGHLTKVGLSSWGLGEGTRTLHCENPAKFYTGPRTWGLEPGNELSGSIKSGEFLYQLTE